MRTHTVKKLSTLMLAASLLGAQAAPLHAAVIGTGQVLAVEQGRLDRANLAAMLEREDLQRQLSALGVDVDDARMRVAGLTDAEVAQLNQRVAELPAGSGVVGVILVIFLIFIITDAIGATDIFPFVDPVR